MLILLSGENGFERSRYANALLEEFIKKHGNLGIQKFSLPENNLSEIIDFVRNNSFFSPTKLCFLSDFNFSALLKQDTEDFLKLLNSVMTDEKNIILISSPVFLKEFISLFKEASIYKDFSIPQNQFLIEFIQKEAKKRRISLSKEDSFNLIDGFGSDIPGLVNEIERISLSGEKIKKDEFSGYELFPAVSKLRYARNRAEKMYYLEIVLNYLNADAGHAFNLLSAAAPKSVKAEDWYRLFADYDVLVKSGDLNYEEALLDFVLQ